MTSADKLPAFPAEPTVADFMTKTPATIDSDFKLSDALDRMYADNIRHLPVLNDRERLIGMLSTRDIAMAAQGDDSTLADKTVFDAMTSDPYTCGAETPLVEAVHTLESRRLGSAIVVDGPRIIGMFTVIDALRALRSAVAGEMQPATVVPRHLPEEAPSDREHTVHRSGERHLKRGSRLQSSMRWALFNI